MKTYTVKDISEMLNINPETVRRWIRTGKLKATKDSRKSGNIVSEQMLHSFLKSSPKYAALVASTFTPVVGLTVFTTALLGGLLTTQLIDNGKTKQANISTTELKKLLKTDIEARMDAIERKEATIRQLQDEAESEQAAINEALRLIDEIDKQENSTKKDGV